MPNARSVNIAVLGSTGSIGASTLDVVAASQGRLTAAVLAARCRTDVLLQQAQRFRPRQIVVTDAEAAGRQDWSALPKETELLVGEDHLAQVVARPEIHTVVAAIVGAAGLQSTWAALEAGKRVALANKETLVMAGPLVMQLAAHTGSKSCRSTANTVPYFNACTPAQREEVKRIVLTASGGPFRNSFPRPIGPRHRRTGTRASHLGHGPENHDRLGHDDEQGPGDCRSPLAVRFAA